MRKMTECPTKNAWIKSVARPEAVISCMRLDQQACDNNIVEKLRELVFRKPKDAQVHILHSNVHSDLKEEVKYSVIHSVPCEHSPSESGDLMMLVVLARAVNPTHLVHYEVQPGEEKVISYDSKRNLACQAPESNETNGRWLGLATFPGAEKNCDSNQITHELEVTADGIEDHTIMSSEY